MCGITAVFKYRPRAAPVDREQLLRVRDAMLHRGPDGAGLWISEDRQVGLAHRRLSVIDLSDAGSQPMVDESGQLRIVFNGEIYNYKELREDLASKGHRFHSRSDTEVVLCGYREYGQGVFNRLRGMFAFAIWDAGKNGLLLARDPFGIKPLYYADDGSTVWAASQVKALAGVAVTHLEPDCAGYVSFFLWGFVPDPYTLYRRIRALPAGTSLWVDQNGVRAPKPFFSIPAVLAEAEAEEQRVELQPCDLRQQLRADLVDSVRSHLVADVPVGVFLSAGRDSSTLVALASEILPRVKTVTLGFREYQRRSEDEVPIAEAVARHYGTEHQTVWVSSEDFADELDVLLGFMDQPSVDGVNSYFVSKAAKAVGLKVVLSGLGGDELFGGYASFRQVPAAVRLLRHAKAFPRFASAFRMASARAFRAMDSPKYASLFEYGSDYAGAYLLRRGLYMPWELERFMPPDVVSQGLEELRTLQTLATEIEGIRSPRLRVSALELAWYMRSQLLRDVDWASMAHSVEVRVPFVDAELLKRLAPLLASRRPPTKADLSRTPIRPLPDVVLKRKKTGFSIPVRSWVLSGARVRGESGVRPWAKRVVACWQDREAAKRLFIPRSVVVFRIGQLGDALVSIPAIAAIRARHPAHRLVLLSDAPGIRSRVAARDVLGPLGWFREMLQYSPSGNLCQTLRTSAKLIAAIRRLQPEYVYDLSPQRRVWQAWRDEFFFRGLGSAENYFGSKPWIEPQRDQEGRLPAVEPEWLRLVRVVRPASKAYRAPLVDLPVAADRVRATLLAAGVRDGLLVALAPGSKMPAKMWPLENFSELGRQILHRYPQVELVVVGGEADKELGNALCAALGERTHNVAGELSLYESAAVLMQCLCYVGNDTGTMHLAALVGIPCVALFSARDYPGKWDPFGEHHVVLRRDVPCAGCMLEVCREQGNRCLRLITVEEAGAAVDSVLPSAILAWGEALRHRSWARARES